MVAVGEESLASGRRETDGVGEHAQGERLGEARDGVELAHGQHLLDECLRVGEPALAKPAERGGTEDPREHGAGRVVMGWVGFQQQAGWAPRLFVAEVAHSDARGGLKTLPVGQGRVDVLVASHRVDVVPVEVHHGPGIAQSAVQAGGIFERFRSEGIGAGGRQRSCSGGHGEVTFRRRSQVEHEPVGARPGNADEHALARGALVVVENRIAMVGNAVEHRRLARSAGPLAA